MTGGLTSRRLSRSAAVLLIAVMLLRALVPAGYMPDAAAAQEGRLGFVICHGGDDAGPPSVANGSGDERVPAAPGKPSGCEYAVLSAAWLVSADADAVPVPDQIATAVVSAFEISVTPRRPGFGGGGARAPPLGS